jgi:predicted nucleotidyltransferase
LASHRPPGLVAAYLFGSQARGAAHRESDVDVAVLFDRIEVPDRADRGRQAMRLSAELVGATHRNAVDVVVLNDAPPELAVVALSGRLTYCADAQAERSFARAAMLRLGDLRPFLARTRRIKLEALAR